MLFLLSPAKKLAENAIYPSEIKLTEYFFNKESKQLLDILLKFSKQDLINLLHISDNLAQLNLDRYKEIANKLQHKKKPETPASFLFNGDVYVGLQINKLSLSELNYLQDHLYIISGFYGLLKPFDCIYPYRLEMGSKLINSNGKDLYAFWQKKLTDKLNQELTKNPQPIINLASQEYAKAINFKQLSVDVITPIFKQKRNKELKVIGTFAKKARGMMVRYAAEHNLKLAIDLQKFDLDNYKFEPELSTKQEWIFVR